MNSKFHICRLGILLLFAFILMRSEASAQSMIIQDINFSAFNLGTDTGNGTNSGNQAFNLFDTNLGTLTAVQISLENVVVTGTVSVQNGSTANQTYTNITLDGNYTVQDNFGHSVVLSIATAPAISSTSVTPGSTWTSSTLTAGPAPTQTTTLTIPIDLLNFEGTGTGTTTLNLSSASTQSVTGHGTFTGSQSSTGLGDVVLTYIYTPVPEPTQTAAWMLAFALCVVVGRKYFQPRELCIA